MPELVLAQGGGQFDFVQSFDAGTAGGITALSANVAYLSLVRVGRPLTVTSLRIYVGAASGNVDLGIYSFDGTTWTKLVSTGSTANAGTNAAQSITIAAFTFVPNINYYLACALDNATATVARVAVTSTIGGVGNRVVSKATSFPLPSTITGAGASAFNPWIGAF